MAVVHLHGKCLTCKQSCLSTDVLIKHTVVKHLWLCYRLQDHGLLFNDIVLYDDVVFISSERTKCLSVFL